MKSVEKIFGNRRTGADFSLPTGGESKKKEAQKKNKKKIKENREKKFPKQISLHEYTLKWHS